MNNIKIFCGITEDIGKLQEEINTLFEQGYVPINISSGVKDKKHELCILLKKYSNSR